MKQSKIIPPKPPLPAGVKETPPMLINEISRLFDAKMRESDREMTQLSTRLIIRNLARHDGVSQLDLVNITHLRPSTVSITLKKLENDGYVRREADPDDLRAVRVFITDAGRKLNDDSRSRVHETDAIIMNGITESESEIMLGLLKKMRDNILEALGPKGEH